MEDEEELPTWVRYINSKPERDDNINILMLGPPGSGKSGCCLSVAEQVDPNFCIDRIAFSAKDLIKLAKDPNLKSGSVIILEEAGVEAGSAKWHSAVNIALNSVLQTFRNRNFILLINLPYISLLAKAHRTLIDATFEMDKRYSNFVKVKPMTLEYNQWKDKFYNKYLRKEVDGRVFPVKRWRIKKPSAALWAKYKKKSDKYKAEILDRALKMIEDDENKGKGKKNPRGFISKEVIVRNLLRSGRTYGEIIRITGMPERTVQNYSRKAKEELAKEEVFPRDSSLISD